MALTLPGQLKLLKNTPDVLLFAAIHGAQLGLNKLLVRLYPIAPWPTDRAVGAQPGLAKLLARLYPASLFLVIYFSSKLALS